VENPHDGLVNLIRATVEDDSNNITCTVQDSSTIHCIIKYGIEIIFQLILSPCTRSITVRVTSEDGSTLIQQSLGFSSKPQALSHAIEQNGQQETALYTVTVENSTQYQKEYYIISLNSSTGLRFLQSAIPFCSTPGTIIWHDV